MSGPARAGVSIYAKDKTRLASFYQSILGMSQLHDSADVTVLQSPDIQLVIHRIPEARASTTVIDEPAKIRDSALKFFFTVESIKAIRPVAQELGGGIGDEQWQGPGFIVCNGHDLEGNVFHVRESYQTIPMTLSASEASKPAALLQTAADTPDRITNSQ